MFLKVRACGRNKHWQPLTSFFPFFKGCLSAVAIHFYDEFWSLCLLFCIRHPLVVTVTLFYSVCGSDTLATWIELLETFMYTNYLHYRVRLLLSSLLEECGEEN